MHVTDSMRSAIGHIAAGFAVKQFMPCACANIHSQITSCVVAMIILQCCASMLVSCAREKCMLLCNHYNCAASAGLIRYKMLCVTHHALSTAMYTDTAS
eukprot:5175-Heterococcus_DN1.PRE.1